MFTRDVETLILNTNSLNSKIETNYSKHSIKEKTSNLTL